MPSVAILPTDVYLASRLRSRSVSVDLAIWVMIENDKQERKCNIAIKCMTLKEESKENKRVSTEHVTGKSNDEV